MPRPLSSRTARLVALGVGVVFAAVAITVAVTIGGGDNGSEEPARLRVALDEGESSLGASLDAAFPIGVIRYEAGPELAELGGTLRAYRLPATPVDRSTVEQLATALGLSGAVESDEAGGGWLVNDNRGTLSVYAGGGASWFYGSGRPDQAVSSSIEPGEVEPPLRPANLPSKDEAVRIARDLLAKASIDTAGSEVEVLDGQTSWVVQFHPGLDGIRTVGLETTVTVGDHSEVLSASGYLAEAVPADEYPLMGTGPAIDRLNEGRGRVGPVALGALSSGAGAEGAGEPGVVEPAEPSEPSEPLPTESVPPEPSEPPEPQVVTLVDGDVRLAAMPAGTSGDAYLVPAYVLVTEAGEEVAVVAVDDQYVAEPEPDPTRTLGGYLPITGGKWQRFGRSVDPVGSPFACSRPCPTDSRRSSVVSAAVGG